MISRMLRIAHEEIAWIRPRYWVLNGLLNGLPEGTGMRLRTNLYRAFGLDIGSHGKICGTISFTKHDELFRNIHIGDSCYVNSQVFMDATAPITIGNHVSIGHHACIITANHEIGPSWCRAGTVDPRPVTIEDGAWIAARVILMPGVNIGAGAVVSAGSVVTRDVTPHTVVFGIPARVVRVLEE